MTAPTEHPLAPTLRAFELCELILGKQRKRLLERAEEIAGGTIMSHHVQQAAEELGLVEESK